MNERLATVFQTRAATVRKARSPTVDWFDVGMANVFDDHDRSRCLDSRSLMLCRSTDRYAGASPCRYWYTRTADNLSRDNLPHQNCGNAELLGRWEQNWRYYCSNVWCKWSNVKATGRDDRMLVQLLTQWQVT